VSTQLEPGDCAPSPNVEASPNPPGLTQSSLEACLSDSTEDDRMAHWRLLEGRYAEVVGSYDRTLLALSGGALGLSLAFISDVVEAPAHLRILWAGWTFLALAMATTLAGTLTSQWAIRKDMDALSEGRELENSGGWPGAATDVLGIAGAVSFMLGIALIVGFVGLNLW